MKIIKLSLFIILFFAANQMTFSQDVVINERTVIKDSNGKRITIETLSKKLKTKKWTVVPLKDANSNPFVLLRKASDEEKNTIKAPVFKEVEINRSTRINQIKL